MLKFNHGLSPELKSRSGIVANLLQNVRPVSWFWFCGVIYNNIQWAHWVSGKTLRVSSSAEIMHFEAILNLLKNMTANTLKLHVIVDSEVSPPQFTFNALRVEGFFWYPYIQCIICKWYHEHTVEHYSVFISYVRKATVIYFNWIDDWITFRWASAVHAILLYRLMGSFFFFNFCINNVNIDLSIKGGGGADSNSFKSVI